MGMTLAIILFVWRYDLFWSGVELSLGIIVAIIISSVPLSSKFSKSGSLLSCGWVGG